MTIVNNLTALKFDTKLLIQKSKGFIGFGLTPPPSASYHCVTAICNAKLPPPHHTTTTVLRPFFRDHPGEPVPEENFWILWCKERLTEADTLTIRLGATPSGLTSAHLHHPPIFFYVPDALPAAQPTASKH